MRMTKSRTKKRRTQSVRPPVAKLPRPNVVFLGSGVMIDPEFNITDEESQSFTAEGSRGIICNPIYAGVPPYEPIVDDETWVRAAAKAIREQGVEQFLVNMLFVLRMSMAGALTETNEDDDKPRETREQNLNSKEEP